MEPVIEIPAPNARDSETVVTALETAAVFRAKGDTAEALRWLQRAAESAGDDGDDERTLALARTAADLSRTLKPISGTESPAQAAGDHLTPTHSRRLPKPPPRLGAAQPESDEGNGPPSLGRHAHTPSPPSQSLNQRPPLPPSSRPMSAPSSSRAAFVTNSASSTPASSRAPQSLRGSQRQPAPASTTPKRLEPRAAESSGATPEADTDAQRLTQRAAAPAPQAEPVRTSKLRLAARVSVAPSPSEPGLFLVRLLEDGAAAPSDVAEALMVLVDPNSTVFLD